MNEPNESKLPPLTIVAVLDREHLAEFQLVWPTWKLHHPQLVFGSRLLVMCDCDEHDLFWWDTELYWLYDEHEQVTLASADDILPRPFFHATHRERMLACFVYAPQHIATPYFLKLDTDTVAFPHAGQTAEPWWFEHSPVFVAPRWGFTKPADAIQRLDDWGDTLEALQGSSRLDIRPRSPREASVRHPRAISYVYYGRTDWHQWLVDLCGDRLPVPSHDTLTSYVAERTKAFWRPVNMAERGWRHISPRNLRLAAQQSLAQRETVG